MYACGLGTSVSKALFVVPNQRLTCLPCLDRPPVGDDPTNIIIYAVAFFLTTLGIIYVQVRIGLPVQMIFVFHPVLCLHAPGCEVVNNGIHKKHA